MSRGDNKRAGEEAVARVLLRLTERGFDCAMPAGDNAAWDLISEKGGKVNRIQVKSTNRRSRPDSSVYHIRVQRGGDRRSYKKSEFDQLICVLPWACFIIPAAKALSSGKRTFGFWEAGKHRKSGGACEWEKYKDAWHFLE